MCACVCVFVCVCVCVHACVCVCPQGMVIRLRVMKEEDNEMKGGETCQLDRQICLTLSNKDLEC